MPLESIVSFGAGFVSGWVTRASFDSFRGLAVRTLATAIDLAGRLRKRTVMEREYFEDLVAEARAMAHTLKVRRANGEGAPGGRRAPDGAQVHVVNDPPHSAAAPGS